MHEVYLTQTVYFVEKDLQFIFVELSIISCNSLLIIDQPTSTVLSENQYAKDGYLLLGNLYYQCTTVYLVCECVI